MELLGPPKRSFMLDAKDGHADGQIVSSVFYVGYMHNLVCV